MADYDLAIIGGGINGAGIARDAAGRGLRVLLVEKGDLASGTSSASTKLIHGGLRYLEHCEFRLVREALAEREVLLRMAPHIIWPMRFVLPAVPGLRSPFMLRLGLFLYDYLGGRKMLPATAASTSPTTSPASRCKRKFRYGFEYSDCWVDDARLVVLNARDAAERGAVIRTRTRVARAEREDVWQLILNARGRREVVDRARAGQCRRPLGRRSSPRPCCGMRGPPPVRLVKGSHIVVRKLFDHDRGYIFQNTDGRIIFAIPYERRFHADRHHRRGFHRRSRRAWRRAPTRCSISAAPRASISASRSSREQVVWTFAGVRPLYDDERRQERRTPRATIVSTLDERTARRRCSTSTAARSPPIAGSPRRRWASSRISSSCTRRWTATTPLPGGDFLWDAHRDARRADAAGLAVPRRGRGAAAGARLRHAGRPRARRRQAARRSRRRASAPTQRRRGALSDDSTNGRATADDVLWRRTKLGLRVERGRKGRADAIHGARPRTRLSDRRELPPRHRPGHDLDPRDRVRRSARAGRDRAAGVHPDLSGARAGSSTIRRRSGRPWSRPCATALAKAGVERQRHRRHRHHQPARDHDRLGPRDRQADPQRHRLAGPPHRRRLRGAARRRPRSRRSRTRPGCCSIPISRHQDRLAARQRRRRARGGRGGPARVRHGRQLPDLAADRRQGARHRRHQCVRARCCSTSAPAHWDDELLRAVRACRARCCRRCATAPPISARPLPELFGGADPHSRRRRRPAGGDHRAGLLRARHDEIDLRHRLLRAAQHRRRAGARRATGCSPPSPISSTASAPMRSKARSSSPAPRCSGCATALQADRAGVRRRTRSPPQADPAEQVYLVPAFVGLGAP